MNVKAKSFGQIFLVLLLSVLLVVPSMTVAATWATPDDGNEQPGDNPDGDNNDGNNGGNNNQGAGNANSGHAGESPAQLRTTLILWRISTRVISTTFSIRM